MAVQPFIRRGVRSNATARRLIATSQHVAQHVIESTVYDIHISKSVQRCRAQFDVTLAGIELKEQQVFYLVASKFQHRAYVVAQVAGMWICSSSDERVRAYCIGLVFSARKGGRKAA